VRGRKPFAVDRDLEHTVRSADHGRHDPSPDLVGMADELRPHPLQKLHPSDPIRKPRVVVRARYPLCAALAGIDQQETTPKARQINCRCQPSGPAADDDGIEVRVLSISSVTHFHPPDQAARRDLSVAFPFQLRGRKQAKR
jgi:hypothetical protein